VADGRTTTSESDPGLLETLVGDGRPLLYVVAISLLFAGGFALFLSASRQFLPQDLAFLRMTPDELCRVSGCKVVDFMVHDRVAFGGSLMAVGLFYLWLTAPPVAGPGVGMVDVRRQRRSRVRRLPHVPGVRVPGHMARRRDAPARTVVRRGSGARASPAP
jgi:hypothetical protein